jgi:hypothetical protein
VAWGRGMANYYAMALDDLAFTLRTGARLYDDDEFPDWPATPAEARWDMLYRMLAELIDVMTPPLPDNVRRKSALSAVLLARGNPALGRALGREVQACRDALHDMALMDTRALLLAAERDLHARYERVEVL